MKFYRYWSESKHHIRVAGRDKEIRLLTGSAVSEQDALREAEQQAGLIEQRIASGEEKQQYETAIKEFISEQLDDQNVVSVCRYGAKILNSSQYTFYDIDHVRYGLFDFFKGLHKLTPKQRMARRFTDVAKKFPQLGTDFRIYETAKGIRVIGRQYLDPTAASSARIMARLNVDWLYTKLSRKQQCYRARLTPKPFRMKIKTIRVRSPLMCQTDEYRQWDDMYRQAASRYAVVNFVEAIGRDFAQEPVIRYHDDCCQAHSQLKLA